MLERSQSSSQAHVEYIDSDDKPLVNIGDVSRNNEKYFQTSYENTVSSSQKQFDRMDKVPPMPSVIH